MEPLIARAFLTLLLMPDQLTDLKDFEITQPPGYYLEGFELVRRYKLLVDSINSEREAGMIELLNQWRSRNWKDNQIENKHHDAGLMERTYQQEIHAWMNYVLKNWHETLPKPSRLVDTIA